MLRSNIRQLDRDIQRSKQAEVQAKNHIKAADKRAQRTPARAVQARKDMRDFAHELVRVRKTTAQLTSAKAQVNSVQLQVNEAFSVRKIEGSMKASMGIMKDVNKLIKLPQLSQTMQDLSVELMKAGIIEEMVEDILPEDGEMLGEDEEAQVDRILGEVLKDKTEKEPSLPVAPEPEPQQAQPQVEEEEEDPEVMMDQMRNRLNALRS